ncbi:MAG: lamin tail domain-containing protein [Bacteroidota bacterium]|nr:lamin tail domain-containing protein [Bacteroidota bacterium]
MNKLLTLFFALAIYSQSTAQVIINEIMYNPPEAGADYLEFIELYNTSSNPVSLNGYKIMDAFVFNFPDTILVGNGYFVICNNLRMFDSIFQLKALEWNSPGALRNDGEIISLLNGADAVVDSVRYGNTSAWPEKATGKGSSIELCRPNVDNGRSEYWKASTTATGDTVDGKAVFATPGAVNNVNCADHEILVSNFSYSPSNLEIAVGEHVEWRNLGGAHNVNGDTATFDMNPESFSNGFPSSSAWTFIKRFDIVGVYNYRCDAHPAQMRGVITVKPKNTQYPRYAISTINSVNAQGIADSLNVKCELDGVVYGINIRPAGLQFTIIDAFNDGITVFNASGNYAYTVKEGDRIAVRGTIDQFNGLLEIIPDTIIKLSTNNPLVSPQVVVALNEQTESQLIQINNVQLLNPVTWTNNPNGFTVKVSDGVVTYDVRIDNDSDIFGKQAPGGTFDITGLGTQNDPSSPFLEGYQILPRYLNDINPYIPGGNPGNYPKRNIASVTTTNAAGVVDSLGKKFELQGIVYGIDLNGNTGLQFTIIDATGGIGAFSSTKSFNYTVTEGDDVKVQGTIDQFRGFTQIILDTIIKVSAGNPLKPAKLVTALDESTESELIELRNLTIVDPQDWRGDGTSFNVRLNDGTKDINMRIDDNCDLSTTQPLGSKLNVKGIGSQFDVSSPFDSDYQILPRYKADITWLTATSNNEPINIHIQPLPVSHVIHLTGDLDLFNEFEIVSIDGKLLKKGTVTADIHFDSDGGIYFLRLKHRNYVRVLSFLKID